jgi:ABC-type sugar transport system permease subunit
MKHLSRVLALFFVFVVLSSLLLVGSCVASVDNVKPVVPSFTLKEIAQPYDVPPSSTTIVDGYTGEKTTIDYPGYHVENKTVYIVIKNQPFTPYKYDEYTMAYLHYEYSWKPHYSDGGWFSSYPEYFSQSDSEYTMIPFNELPSDGKIDIRVRALAGGISRRQPIPPESGDRTYYSFSGVKGDFGVITVSSDMVLESTSWPSSTVLPTNPENSEPSTSDNYNPPMPPQQSLWVTYLLTVIVVVCIITIPLVVVVYVNKRQQLSKVAFKEHWS